MLRITYLSVNLPNLSLNFFQRIDMLTKVTCKSKKKISTTFFRESLLFLPSLVLRISNKGQLFEL